nr:EOG090X02Z1 [Macrothrix elegans]
MVNRKVTIPGSFSGHSGTPAVGCSYKAAAGYLYPLERGFIYVHKPPIHLRFDEIASVNFARGGGSTRSFDFEVETKSGVVHTFSSIEKEEYNRLFDFINGKKLRVKNTGRTEKAAHNEDFGDSDEEEAPDAYLARVKAEGKQRDEIGNDSDGESDETDEDFKPGEESDVAEEYDSNVATTDSDASDASGKSGSGSGSDSKSKKKKKEKKEKKQKKEKKEKKEKEPKSSSKSSSQAAKTPKQRKPKKEKDENKPKRAQSAYMLWLNDTRDKIKADNPGISVTELTKKAGELWKKVEDRSKWEAKAKEAKEAYDRAMKEYNASGGASQSSKSKEKESKSSSKSSSKPSPKVAKPSPMKMGDFKSKEYISSEDDSSSDSDKDKKKKKPDSKSSKKPEKKPDKKEKKKESEDEDDDDEEDEEILSTPESSEMSDDDSD